MIPDVLPALIHVPMSVRTFVRARPLTRPIGHLWFGERRLRARLAGAAVVLAGVVCIALAR